jgi:hypothetical protein
MYLWYICGIFQCVYNVFWCICSMFQCISMCLNVFYWHCNWISPSHSHCNIFTMQKPTHLFFTLYNDSLPNMLYHYIPFFLFPLIHSNFHTIYPYFSHLYITPHSTFHVVIGCIEHSGAQVYVFWNTLKYIVNAFKNIQVHYNQMHWRYIDGF